MEDSGDSALRVVKSFVISKEEDQGLLFYNVFKTQRKMFGLS